MFIDVQICRVNEPPKKGLELLAELRVPLNLKISELMELLKEILPNKYSVESKLHLYYLDMHEKQSRRPLPNQNTVKDCRIVQGSVLLYDKEYYSLRF